MAAHRKCPTCDRHSWYALSALPPGEIQPSFQVVTMASRVVHLVIVAALSLLLLASGWALDAKAGSPLGKVHTYYIAADEVEWDYAPSGLNKMMGMKFEGYPNVFIEQGPHRIGKVYRKAIYREY